MKKSIIRQATSVLCLTLLLLIGGCKEKNAEPQLPDSAVILTAIQQRADIVTTEITVRKIAIYDSSLHEQVSIANPSTWKYGERKCIVPVDVTIKYGYDLREITLDNVKVNDSLRVVELTLPEPKVISSGYSNDIDYSKVVSISTGMRDKVGHETIEKIRKMAYEEVMKEDFIEIAGNEIRQNAQAVFTTMAQSMGFESCTIRR